MRPIGGQVSARPNISLGTSPFSCNSISFWFSIHQMPHGISDQEIRQQEGLNPSLCVLRLLGTIGVCCILGECCGLHWSSRWQVKQALIGQAWKWMFHVIYSTGCRSNNKNHLSAPTNASTFVEWKFSISSSLGDNQKFGDHSMSAEKIKQHQEVCGWFFSGSSQSLLPPTHTLCTSSSSLCTNQIIPGPLFTMRLSLVEQCLWHTTWPRDRSSSCPIRKTRPLLPFMTLQLYYPRFPLGAQPVSLQQW